MCHSVSLRVTHVSLSVTQRHSESLKGSQSHSESPMRHPKSPGVTHSLTDLAKVDSGLRWVTLIDSGQSWVTLDDSG